MRFRELVTHLARRELASAHRFTVFGVLWPLFRLLAQWGVLAFVFTSLVDLGIADYPAFLLCGLVAWAWFATGVTAGTASILDRRHLALQPRVPVAVLPAVAVAVPVADVALALPVLVAVIALDETLSWTLVMLPVLLAAQYALMCGVVWTTSATAVYLRDVRKLVDVVLTLLFYMTPVFYDPRRVPEDLRWVVEVNPLAQLLEGWRAILIEGEPPDAGSLLVVAAWASACLAVGWLVFNRLRPGFVDEL